MKNLLKKYFGILGLVIYFPFALIVRIPVFIFLAVVVVVDLLIWNPLTGRDSSPNWLNRLYDWYRGE